MIPSNDIDTFDPNAMLAYEMRENLLSFAIGVNPAYQIAHFHKHIADRLMAIERGEIKRLIVVMPPRHGKSELCSKLFPAWFIGRNPKRRVILSSYVLDLARDLSGHTKDIVKMPIYQSVFNGMTAENDNAAPAMSLSKDTHAAYKWNTNLNGGMMAVGVGGSITGYGADLLIGDDFFKNLQEAQSKNQRDKVWRWFTTVFMSRLQPNGAVVLPMTRWHVDDVIGRILKGDLRDKWEVIVYPVFDTQAHKWLWPEWFTESEYNDIKLTMGAMLFNAIYQGDPKVMAGDMFKVDRLKLLPLLPNSDMILRSVYYWDKAGTADGGCYTAGVHLAECNNLWHGPRYVILKAMRGQWSALQRESIIKVESEIASFQTHRRCRIVVEQEPGSGGKESAEATIKNLAGLNIHADRPHGDKATRGLPFAAQVEAGFVGVLETMDTLNDFIDEMQSFPNGATKDYMDAANGAFNMLTGGLKKFGVWGK